MEVIVAPGRMVEGLARLELAAGGDRIFRCLARSDSSAAIKAGNPTRDPLEKMGDLPAGEYSAVLTPMPAARSAATIRTYGAGPLYLLKPTGGTALEAKKRGRAGLMIHGGATGKPMPPGALRPTHGCLRMDDDAIAFMAAQGPVQFAVVVRERPR